MSWTAQYLLKVTVSAILCSILTAVLGKKGILGPVIKLIAGVYMTLTVLSPWVSIRLQSLEDLSLEISMDAASAVEEGEKSAAAAMTDIITGQTQAYILDKAESLGAQLRVEVMLSDDGCFTPCRVTLSGSISPYARQVLSAYIAENLGISTEDQIWNS